MAPLKNNGSLRYHMATLIVKLENKEQTFNVNCEEVLYDQIENQGLKLPAGCLAGSCGTCRVEVLAGRELLSPPGAIESNTIAAVSLEYNGTKKIRLSCRMKIIKEGLVTIFPLKK
jgi:ferredoxin